MNRWAGAILTCVVVFLAAMVGALIGHGELQISLQRPEATAKPRTTRTRRAIQRASHERAEDDDESVSDLTEDGDGEPLESIPVERVAAVPNFGTRALGSTMLGSTSLGSITISDIKSISGPIGTATWDPASDVYLPSKIATVDMAATVSGNFMLASNPPGGGSQKLGPFGISNSGSPSVTLPVGYRGGLYAVDDQAGMVKTPPITIFVPAGTVPSPNLALVANGKYAVPAAIPTSNNPVSVFGGYLRITAQSSEWKNAALYYVLIDTNNNNVKPRKKITQVPSTTARGSFDLEIFDLPASGGYTLFVLADTGTDFAYSSNSIPISINAVGVVGTPAPTIKAVTPDAPVNSSSAKYTTNVRTFIVTVDIATAVSGLHDGAQIVIYDDKPGVTVPGTPLNRPELTPITPADAVPVQVTVPKDGTYNLRAVVVQGPNAGTPSAAVAVNVQTGLLLKVAGVSPPNFGTAPGARKLTIAFTPGVVLNQPSAELKENYSLLPSNGTGKFDQVDPKTAIPASTATLSPTSDSVTLSFDSIQADIYQLTIHGKVPTDTTKPNGIRDGNGNFLAGNGTTAGTDYFQVLTQPGAAATESASPYVVYPEYTAPNKVPNGFNPSDHVETRVCRLYYYRDARRVAQIVNRSLKAYRKAAVDTAQQAAETAQTLADKTTDDRRASERKAVSSAQSSRAAERQLQAAQAQQGLAKQKDDAAQQNVKNQQAQVTSLQQQIAANNAALAAAQPQQSPPTAGGAGTTTGGSGAAAGNTGAAAGSTGGSGGGSAVAAPSAGTSDTSNVTALTAEGNQLQTQLNQANLQLTAAQTTASTTAASLQTATQNASNAQAALQTARQTEADDNENAQVKTATEDRAAEDAFRKLAAARHEDPDSFAPGKPDSDDPVQRVSVSVIGEGVIQLRGPVKGINIVRVMINEIDAPVGQVSIAIHTVQVNGEHGDRMEPVLGRIEKYLDHSRFLTAQSAQMLRNAVVTVASRHAEGFGPGGGNSQDLRDQRYLYAFFGRDFVEELQSLDSEFLKTGNKLLTLHSMDSTSLASAMFLLALSKNSIRQEILAEFRERVMADLPQMECDYFQAGGGKKAYGCGKFKCFSTNARFTSLLGQFNNSVLSDDTMTPLQREFIRLAQIFKSRLVVEMELNERIMERAMIEDRSAGATIDRDKAFANEIAANSALQKAKEKKLTVRQEIREAIAELAGILETIEAAQRDKARITDTNVLNLLNSGQGAGAAPRAFSTAANLATGDDGQDTSKSGTITINEKSYNVQVGADGQLKCTDPSQVAVWKSAVRQVRQRDAKISEAISGPTNKTSPAKSAAPAPAVPSTAPFTVTDAENSMKTDLQADAIRKSLHKIVNELSDLRRAAAKSGLVDPISLDENWVRIRAELQAIDQIRDNQSVKDAIKEMTDALSGFIDADNNLTIAQQKAQSSRVPLDHKKLLDMLVDQTTEKYIELLEGTRAHTANIDNYIKRLITALDDDLNTQFYFPAFREVRNASRMWDVELGQVETTSILTNNRGLGIVKPQATMEFDLPKRDILIKEAFQGGKALMDSYGALLQDPTFLALGKLGSGQSTSSSTASGATNSTVKNVTPGLPSQTDEQLLTQQGPGNTEFGAALDALIPDPAIYKFETGTGYEVRPVIQPDGQAVAFHLQYMYSTNVREPVRADEKHLGRIKRHFIDTDVQLSNFELRKISRYLVALKASRTAKGVPLLQDAPVLGALFRPLPSAESALQQNLILGQATIFPTLFDLMGLRWAPAVADLDALRLINDDFVVRSRHRDLRNRVYDRSSSNVDASMQIPQEERRTDLYRSQETIPTEHPDGYRGPGLNLRDSQMREGYNPVDAFPESRGIRGTDKEGTRRVNPQIPGADADAYPVDEDQGSVRRISPTGKRQVNHETPSKPPVRKKKPATPTTSSAKSAIPDGPDLTNCAPMAPAHYSLPPANVEPRKLAGVPRGAKPMQKQESVGKNPARENIQQVDYSESQSEAAVATVNPSPKAAAKKKSGAFAWLTKSGKD